MAAQSESATVHQWLWWLLKLCYPQLAFLEKFAKCFKIFNPPEQQQEGSSTETKEEVQLPPDEYVEKMASTWGARFGAKIRSICIKILCAVIAMYLLDLIWSQFEPSSKAYHLRLLVPLVAWPFSYLLSFGMFFPKFLFNCYHSLYSLLVWPLTFVVAIVLPSSISGGLVSIIEMAVLVLSLRSAVTLIFNLYFPLTLFLVPIFVPKPVMTKVNQFCDDQGWTPWIADKLGKKIKV